MVIHIEAEPSVLYSAHRSTPNTLIHPDMAMQAGHFGQAVFDPAGLTDDYKRQAEVSIFAFSKCVNSTRSICLPCCCMQPATGCLHILVIYAVLSYYDPHVALHLSSFHFLSCSASNDSLLTSCPVVTVQLAFTTMPHYLLLRCRCVMLG